MLLKRSGCDTDGLMNWYQATARADGQKHYDSVHDVTRDDWRRPTSQGTGIGPLHESEMERLYCNEGVIVQPSHNKGGARYIIVFFSIFHLLFFHYRFAWPDSRPFVQP